MRRRGFLTSFAAAGVPPVAFAQRARSGELKITAVEVWRVQGRVEVSRMEPGQGNSQPIHIYEEFRPTPLIGDNKLITKTQNQSRHYLRIGADAGVEGLYGPIDREAVTVVNRQLKPFLMGKDPLAGETLWDQMYRRNRHSRRGHYMMGVAAVDNCLWDLRGRYFNTPVYRLLGGPTRPAAQAYGSTLGHSTAPEPAKRRAREFAQQGFVHQKWFLPYSPVHGAAGLERNVELVRNLREAVGDEVDIMFDAFSAWDLNYAVAWAKRVEQYHPRWIEEAFSSDKIQSFVELRRKTSVPVATGEHFYSRWETHEFLKAGAISVVQADPEWCGGVSELVKICAVASVYDAQVIPHGHNLHAALHVVLSQSPMTCPLVEYLIDKMRNYYVFDKNQLHPVSGKIALPEWPGFGMELDDSKVEKRELVET